MRPLDAVASVVFDPQHAGHVDERSGWQLSGKAGGVRRAEFTGEFMGQLGEQDQNPVGHAEIVVDMRANADPAPVVIKRASGSKIPQHFGNLRDQLRGWQAPGARVPKHDILQRRCGPFQHRKSHRFDLLPHAVFPSHRRFDPAGAAVILDEESFPFPNAGDRSGDVDQVRAAVGGESPDVGDGNCGEGELGGRGLLNEAHLTAGGVQKAARPELAPQVERTTVGALHPDDAPPGEPAGRAFETGATDLDAESVHVEAGEDGVVGGLAVDRAHDAGHCQSRAIHLRMSQFPAGNRRRRWKRSGAENGQAGWLDPGAVGALDERGEVAGIGHAFDLHPRADRVLG